MARSGPLSSVQSTGGTRGRSSGPGPPLKGGGPLVHSTHGPSGPRVIFRSTAVHTQWSTDWEPWQVRRSACVHASPESVRVE